MRATAKTLVLVDADRLGPRLDLRLDPHLGEKHTPSMTRDVVPVATAHHHKHQCANAAAQRLRTRSLQHLLQRRSKRSQSSQPN